MCRGTSIRVLLRDNSIKKKQQLTPMVSNLENFINRNKEQVTSGVMAIFINLVIRKFLVFELFVMQEAILCQIF